MSHELIVSTDIPSGNACVLEIRTDSAVPEVHFTPSPLGGPEAMWFHFQVKSTSTTPPAQIRCVMHLVDTLLGGQNGRNGFHPVFKTARQDWHRIEAVEGFELPDGRPTVSWLIPGNEGPADTALCYPYALQELDALTADLAPAFRSDVISVTQQGRTLTRLSNDPGQIEGTRPGIYCIARQHAGETPGSWMLDGFLREMADAGDAAPLVWAVPFADLDGVLAGHYGKDAFPWDFNRAWGSRQFPKEMWSQTGSHPMRYEIHCIQSDMRRWLKRCRPMLVFDFHAPGMCETHGIYVFLRRLTEEGQPDASHLPWVNAIHAALGDDLAADQFIRSGRYASRWDTARVGDFVVDALGLPEITFEVPYGRFKQQIVSRETYQNAGRRVARAVMEQMGMMA
jgi:hypothetical protein